MASPAAAGDHSGAMASPPSVHGASFPSTRWSRLLAAPGERDLEALALPTTLLGLDAALVNFAPRPADGPDLADALGSRGAFELHDATTPLARAEAGALLRRALDQAPPGWPHVRDATAALRDATAVGS